MNDKKAARVNVRKMESLSTKIVYGIFEGLILSTLIASIVLAIVRPAELEVQINHIFLCVVALLLYNIPSFLQYKFHFYIPTVLHVFTLIFIFAHFILGEISGLYTYSAIFDKILHTTSGLAIAAIGFSLVNILNESKNTHLKLSPFFVALFSFCFALAVAVIWEIFEFSADSIFGTNMQRYEPPSQVAVEIPPAQGYGLIDTMGDIIVSTIAAFAVSLFGYISLRTKANLLNRLLIRKVPDYQTALEEAREAGDVKMVRVLEQAIAREQNEHDAKSGRHADKDAVGAEGETDPPAAEETKTDDSLRQL